MVKNITVSFLLALMIIRMMAMPIACINYVMNKTFIANVLCVNKSKPVLKCNGHCFLKKQLEKASENDNRGAEKGNLKSITLDCFELTSAYSFEPCPEDLLTVSGYRSLSIPSGFAANIFHPPSLIV